MRSRLVMLVIALAGSLGLGMPSAAAVSDTTHSSCVAGLTSYFKYFG